jgi:sugar transferase EpsL
MHTVSCWCKRGLDIWVSLLGLSLLSPLLLGITILIKLKMGSPVLFQQVRPGFHAKPFTLIKFRTMVVCSTELVDPSADAVRLTSLGHLLRKFSLDEIPQLWNVLRGEMSLVGPRPLLVEYLPFYTPRQARRHEAKPGITGWAQINGRNAITWEQKFELDVWYVDHRSFWLDLWILAMTAKKVVRREDISHPGHATMKKFGAGHS